MAQPYHLDYRGGDPTLSLLFRQLDEMLEILFSSSSVKVKVSTFSSRPSTPSEGMLIGVTDSTTSTWGATVSGGGTNHVLAYYNGTTWTVAAK